MTGSIDRTVKQWLVDSGELVRTMEGHTSDVSALALAPGSGFILSASEDASIKVWEPVSGEVRRSARVRQRPR